MKILEKIKFIICEDTLHQEWNIKFKHIKNEFDNINNIKDLVALKKEMIKKIDANNPKYKDGPVDYFYKERKKILNQHNGKNTNSKDAREDRLLRMRDSSGKATTRKWGN